MWGNFAISVISLLFFATAVGAESFDLNVQDDSFSQVNSVSQLKDVRPDDWAFQALNELGDRYGCIVGYSDSTFRGDRAMTAPLPDRNRLTGVR